MDETREQTTGFIIRSYNCWTTKPYSNFHVTVTHEQDTEVHYIRKFLASTKVSIRCGSTSILEPQGNFQILKLPEYEYRKLYNEFITTNGIIT